MEVLEHSQVEFWQRSLAYKFRLTFEHLYIWAWEFCMDTLIGMEMDIISLDGNTYDFKIFYRLVSMKLNFDAESNRKFKFWKHLRYHLAASKGNYNTNI